MSYSELDFDDGQVACAIGVAAVIARVDEQRVAGRSAQSSHPSKQKQPTTLTAGAQRPPESQARKSPGSPGRFVTISGIGALRTPVA